MCALGDYSALAICPGLALLASALGLVLVAPHMPRKTSQGAEEAAKWLAFKRYLETIEKHGDLAEVKDKFEEFLPYAIAFGVERSLINKFKTVDTPAPTWWGPVYPGYGYGHPHYGGVWGGSSTGQAEAGGPPGPLAGEGGGMPTLTGMSEGLGTSLASMSDGLGAMLSSASSTLTSTPPPQTSSSGGWSGGGFSGGGFSGGGGGGGGSRGFG
jgi:uncharacterized membrane protein YgcG